MGQQIQQKEYTLYIKNHADGSDYEDSTWADSFEDAVDHFWNSIGDYGYDREMIARNVVEETDDLEALHYDQQENAATGN